MNFALLGHDPAVLPLLSAIAAHPDHALTHAALAGPLQDDVTRIRPGVRLSRNWDELLLVEKLDAVLVAGYAEDTLEGARQLAANGRPLLIVPDVRQGLDWVYQLTLVRDDTRVLLLPLFFQQFAPTVQRARDWIAQGRLGTLLHLQFEREQPPGDGSAGPPLLARDEIDRELLLDVDLLRTLGGDYDQVTAVHTGTVGSRVSLATVTLAGRNLPEASWTLRAVPERQRWLLRATGVIGQLALVSDDARSEPQLIIDGVPDDAHAASSAGGELLSWIERAFDGETVRPNWTDLTRAFEIVDAAHRSLARRRTIELHFETTSERSLFKTQMAAAGCGVLLFTFFAVVVLLIAGAVFDIGHQAMRIARVLIFLPLFLFLALQALLWIARPSIAASQAGQDSAAAPHGVRQP
jgi:predicted dehydrogenase